MARRVHWEAGSVDGCEYRSTSFGVATTTRRRATGCAIGLVPEGLADHTTGHIGFRAIAGGGKGLSFMGAHFVPTSMYDYHGTMSNIQCRACRALSDPDGNFPDSPRKRNGPCAGGSRRAARAVCHWNIKSDSITPTKHPPGSSTKPSQSSSIPLPEISGTPSLPSQSSSIPLQGSSAPG